jgi:hypothetical protein
MEVNKSVNIRKVIKSWLPGRYGGLFSELKSLKKIQNSFGLSLSAIETSVVLISYPQNHAFLSE